MPSCHSGSHDVMPMPSADNESVDADTPVIDDSCSCYVNLPTPFVANGKAQRLTKVEKQIVDLSDDSDVVIVELAAATPASILAETEPPFYLSALRWAGPSRAPPRL